MDQLDSRYDHKAIEDRVYERWEKSGYFNPDNLPYPKTAKPYCIIMPPPNSNGSLHLGHAVFVTLQDILIRFWRMRGRRALWLPGADHAGFETQVVYDKKLDKEGRNRHQMPREDLWKEIWNFTQENKKIMETQLRKLGASCDWSREKFTLDPDIIREVQATFVRMYNDGLIYRGERIINWCSKHQTSLSDVENQFRDQEDVFYYLRYGPFVIGTARPETKFGDKYVVMHPDDARYKKYKDGEKINLEWINGPVVATIIKDKAIDMKFGTGVMTITPWHDATDFEIAERHGLEKEQIIDFHGKLLPIAGEFAGMKIADARPKILEKLKAKGLLVKTDDHYMHSVRVCYKCNTPIEPQIKRQWFVKMESLARKAVETVKKGKIKFYPGHSKKIYFHWLKNIRDWNISRQIVWGIRIPSWYCIGCGAPKVDATIKARWFIVRHGETDFNKKHRFQGTIDAPLNDTGIEQAKSAAEKLKFKKIDLVITSPLIRARKTAEIIAKACGAEIIIENDIRERDFGEWEGLEHDEVKKRYSAELFSRHLDPSFRVPGGESWQEITARMWNAFQKHHKTHQYKNVVVVGHGGVMRTLQNKIKGIPIIESKLVGNAEIWEIELSDPCEKCGRHFYEQDPDVFDTWFSSGQWPFLTLGFGEAQNSPKAKSKKSKIWNLKIYDGKEIFESLRNGTKRFETRAGKPKGAEKDWRKFKTGDVVNFTLVEEGTERVLSNEIITKEIVEIHHFPTIDELLLKFDVNEIHPYHPDEYRSWWESRPHFKERIEKYGIWAFELKDIDTLGYPNGKDFKTFYPTDVMETGHDILFFWVARMIMLGLYRTGKIPFKNVYLHGLVRDKDRQKMSKSKGNVMDPLGVAELYGTDAVRMALVAGNTAGNDIVISEDKIRGYRNFATKIWNIARFVLMNKPTDMPEKILLTKEDKKNLAELAKVKSVATKHIEKFEFHLAAEKIYHYVWHTFADKIIESNKARLRANGEEVTADAAAAYHTLKTILVESLKMLHPFMPFITEEIYGKLEPNKILMVEKWSS